MRRHVRAVVIAAICLGPLAPISVAQTPDELRNLLIEVVGGVERLQVPADDNALPQPDDAAFRITPQKRRLGQLLFFDPVRNNNVKPEFGGVTSMSQTTSCGSCHIGIAAGKAGQTISLAQGGEGFGFIDDITGRFIGDRQPINGMVDLLPTQIHVLDAIGNVVMTGRHDAMDRPLRASPTIIGAAYNQRLLWNGQFGEPYDPDNPNVANANPNGFPAVENDAEVNSIAHRMVDTQRFPLQAIPLYMKLFADAFPTEAAADEASGNPDDLINNNTVLRAIAVFMRTTITRDTPWDRFLAGDDTALTASQRRGAELFLTPAHLGGAGCISCHSGPALNKVLGDEDGLLVDENFHNIGIGDHPLVDLAAVTLVEPDLHDLGRFEATGLEEDLYEFKTPTLRQVVDGAPYMHDGGFETLRDVLEYFNAGIPDAAHVAEAATLSTLFTSPRGEGTVGLGLSDDDLDALEDFLANALYDPAFAYADPNSPTRNFEPSFEDLNWSPAERQLGGVVGQLPSGMAFPNVDARSIAERTIIFGDSTAEPPGTPCGLANLFSLMFLSAGLMGLRFFSTSRRR